MRRAWMLVVVAVLAGAAAPSGAAPQPVKTRTATATYTVGAGIDCERALGCVVFVARAGERYVSLSITDASQTSVYATVTSTRRAAPELFGSGDDICGSTNGSHRVSPGKPLYVYFENHLGSWHNCPGGASRGTVTATFYR